MSLKRIDTADFFQPWGDSSIAENYDRYLEPVDDLPPTTVITHCQRLEDGRLEVRGTTADNGPVKTVVVNDREVEPMRADFAEWRITLDRARSTASELAAVATDSAGNVEPVAHRRRVAEFVGDESPALTNK